MSEVSSEIVSSSKRLLEDSSADEPATTHINVNGATTAVEMVAIKATGIEDAINPNVDGSKTAEPPAKRLKLDNGVEETSSKTAETRNGARGIAMIKAE
jgi:hypothetical protein